MLKGLSHKIKLTHTCFLAPLMLPGGVNAGRTFLPAASGDFRSSWSLGRPPHGNLLVTPEQRRQRHRAAVTRCRSNRKWGRCRSKLAMLFIFFTKIVCAKFVCCSFSLRGQRERVQGGGWTHLGKARVSLGSQPELCKFQALWGLLLCLSPPKVGEVSSIELPCWKSCGKQGLAPSCFLSVSTPGSRFFPLTY